MDTHENDDQPRPHSAGIDAAVAAAITGRRTIGAFQPDIPPRSVILQALDLMRWAPNHKKTEPWHVVWLGPQAIGDIINLNTQLIRESKGEQEAESKRKKWAQTPGWLVVTCDLASDLFRREEDYAATCCAIQNLFVVLWSAGIGTKWSTGDVTRHPDFYRVIGANPAQQRTVGLIWYGYPSSIPEQTRRPVESFLVERP